MERVKLFECPVKAGNQGGTTDLELRPFCGRGFFIARLLINQ